MASPIRAPVTASSDVSSRRRPRKRSSSAADGSPCGARRLSAIVVAHMPTIARKPIASPMKTIALTFGSLCASGNWSLDGRWRNGLSSFDVTRRNGNRSSASSDAASGATVLRSSRPLGVQLAHTPGDDAGDEADREDPERGLGAEDQQPQNELAASR